MKYEVITFGGATVDVFIAAQDETRVHDDHTDLAYHLGDKVLIDNLGVFCGGGGLNAATGFARLGLKTGFVGIVGSDAHALTIKNYLRSEKIDFLGKEKKGMSGYSVILMDKKDRTILTYKGVNNELERNDIPKTISTEWIYFATMLAKSEKTVQAFAKTARAKGIKLAANISSYEARQGLKQLASYLRQLDVLILNKDEALSLTQTKNVVEALQTLRSYVAGTVVITDGANAINAYDGTQMYKQAVPAVQIVSSAGAGDAFAVGFVSAMVRKKDILTGLSWGIKNSQSVLKHMGANVGLLRKL